MSATSPEAIARKKQRKAERYQANKDAIKEHSKAYYIANAEKIRAVMRDKMRQVRSCADYRAKENERRAKEHSAESPQREARRLERSATIELARKNRVIRDIFAGAEREAARIATVAARKDEMKARRYARAKAWKAANKERHAASQAIYMAEYMKTDAGKLNRKMQRSKPRNKMIHNQRSRLREFIKRTGSRVHLRFGCSPDFMRAHI